MGHKTKVVAKDPLAQVTDVRKPGRFGRNGSVKINYLFVLTTHKKQVKIKLGEHAVKTNQSLGLAAGASAGGFIVLGPIGLLGGAFVKGHHIDIPEGTQLMVETEEDATYGVFP